ncbi:hypothetical protein NKR23_g8959 [Pleurostoma richardsiae]|uniref:Uncharacterized protein n=1 Tax=Pleurostoma richardsiae TaxID=41990 RepID=A0AA38RIF6_9PEZI|nr:hypothetical protein NKR23_g8959 [Pleurostoma richardsiae]
MYEFFREAGDEHVRTFFDKDGQPDDIPPMTRIVKDYPLQFVFDDFFEASGPDFTREKVTDVFEKIIVGGYVFRRLHGIIQPLQSPATFPPE